MKKDMLPKSVGVGSSTPQEGGTTDEEYYGQPEPIPIKDLKSTAQKEMKYNPNSDKPQRGLLCITMGETHGNKRQSSYPQTL
jgi:hypothetical protein